MPEALAARRPARRLREGGRWVVCTAAFTVVLAAFLMAFFLAALMVVSWGAGVIGSAVVSAVVCVVTRSGGLIVVLERRWAASRLACASLVLAPCGVLLPIPLAYAAGASANTPVQAGRPVAGAPA